MSRFNRTKFYREKEVDSVAELDFCLCDLQDFEIKRPAKFYTVSYDDIQRPDLICYKIYGQDDYWWILMYVNEIFDVWNDIEENQVLRVPDRKDIQDWYLEVKKKRK